MSGSDEPKAKAAVSDITGYVTCTIEKGIP